jgi:hypothetical protein
MKNNLTNKELLIRIDERQMGLIKGVDQIKNELKIKADKEDVELLRKQVSNIKLASAIVGGMGGIFTAIATLFGFKKVQ